MHVFVLGSGLLLSVNRLWTAVRSGVGLHLWTAQLRDNLASSATDVRLLYVTASRLNASASHCTLSP